MFLWQHRVVLTRELQVENGALTAPLQCPALAQTGIQLRGFCPRSPP